MKRMWIVSALGFFATAFGESGEPCPLWYGRLTGGINFVEDLDPEDFINPEVPEDQKNEQVSFDAGYMVGGALGCHLFGPLRAEGEFGYRRNEFEPEIESLEFTYQNWSLLGNLLLDVQLCDRINPYLGVGAGYGWSQVAGHMSFQDTHFLAGIEKSGFAYQGIAGCALMLSRECDLTLDYRYLVQCGASHHQTVALSLARWF